MKIAKIRDVFFNGLKNNKSQGTHNQISTNTTQTANRSSHNTSDAAQNTNIVKNISYDDQNTLTNQSSS